MASFHASCSSAPVQRWWRRVGGGHKALMLIGAMAKGEILQLREIFRPWPFTAFGRPSKRGGGGQVCRWAGSCRIILARDTNATRKCT